MIDKLLLLPAKTSFQIKKFSSVTNTIDVKSEGLKDFLSEYNYINDKGHILKSKLESPIFGVKIGKFGKFHYAFSINVAIYNAIKEYETRESLKNRKPISVPEKHEALITHNVISQPVTRIIQGKEPKLKQC